MTKMGTMPVEFLSPQQAARYGQYNQEPTSAQLARYFHLDDEDKANTAHYRQSHTRIVFALQLCTVRFLGTFLPDPTQVPQAVVQYVADQLQISDLSCLALFRSNTRTKYEQTQHIASSYGYREFGSAIFALTRWLYQRAWMAFERPSILFDLATAWLVDRKVLLPGVTTLTRLIARIRDRVATRLWERLVQLPSPQQRENLDSLLLVQTGQRNSALEILRKGPTQITGSAMLQALKRLEQVRDLDVGSLSLDGIPAGRLKVLARQVAASWAPNLSRMAEPQRIARLLAFARHYESVALDDALDLFDALVVQSQNRARAAGRKARLRSLRDIDSAALALSELASVLLDESVTDAQLRPKAFTRISRKRAQSAVETIENLTRSPDDDYEQERLSRYQTFRRFLPLMLSTAHLQATQAGKPVLLAWNFLKDTETSGRFDAGSAPMECIPAAWRKQVIQSSPDGQTSTGRRNKIVVDRRAYTLCVLEQVQAALRQRDVFALGSERWGDPRAKLLSGTAWDQTRSTVCRVLEKPLDPTGEMDGLTNLLGETYRRVQNNLPRNTDLRFDESGRMILSPLDRIAEPVSLLALRHKTRSLLPRVDLPELLMEI